MTFRGGLVPPTLLAGYDACLLDRVGTRNDSRSTIRCWMMGMNIFAREEDGLTATWTEQSVLLLLHEKKRPESGTSKEGVSEQTFDAMNAPPSFLYPESPPKNLTG